MVDVQHRVGGDEDRFFTVAPVFVKLVELLILVASRELGGEGVLLYQGFGGWR